MAVTPAVAALADAMRQAMPVSMSALPLEVLRSSTEQMIAPSTVEVAHVADHVVDGPRGPIPIRVYRPSDAGDLPVLVWLHGGGFALGTLAMGDDLCRRLANAVDAVVVNVDYRLAPEHPYPAGFEDCLAVYTWATTGPPELGRTTSRVAVAGDSAGGNLATAVAMKARDAHLPAPYAQVSVYGTAEMRLSNPELGDLPFLTNDDAQWFWSLYLDDPAQRDDPYVSPACAQDLSGLSPLLVVTAEHDPTRDASEAYGHRVQAAGGSAVVARFAGMHHGFFSMQGVLPEADAAFGHVVEFLRAQAGAR